MGHLIGVVAHAQYHADIAAVDDGRCSTSADEGQGLSGDREETYGERFNIPEPQELLMVGWYAGGDVFRSVCTFTRGVGRILYIQPGHETYPTLKNPYIQRIITNGVYWAAPNVKVELGAVHAAVSPEELRKNGETPTERVR